MNVDVVFVEQCCIDAKFVGVCFQIAQRNDGRFFHHIAKVACQGEFARFRFVQTGFDVEYFAADGCPSQSGNNAANVVALIVVVRVAWCAKVFVDAVDGDIGVVGRFGGYFAGGFAHYFGDDTVEFAHARFARVVVDDVPQGFLGQFQLFFVDAVFLQLSRH